MIGNNDKNELESFETKLNVTFLNPGENVPETDENEEVVQNYYRVQSAECLKKVTELSDSGKYEEAK